MLYHSPFLFRSHLYNFFVSFLSSRCSPVYLLPFSSVVKFALPYFFLSLSLLLSSSTYFPSYSLMRILLRLEFTNSNDSLLLRVNLFHCLYASHPALCFLPFPSFSILILFSYSFHMIFDHSLFLYISFPSPSVPVPALLFILIHSFLLSFIVSYFFVSPSFSQPHFLLILNTAHHYCNKYIHILTFRYYITTILILVSIHFFVNFLHFIIIAFRCDFLYFADKSS